MFSQRFLVVCPPLTLPEFSLIWFFLSWCFYDLCYCCIWTDHSLSLIIFAGEVLFFVFYGGQIYETYFSEIKFKAHGKSRSGMFLALICRWHEDWQSCSTEQFGLYNKISYSNKMCFSTARYARTTCSPFGYKVEEYS